MKHGAEFRIPGAGRSVAARDAIVDGRGSSESDQLQNNL